MLPSRPRGAALPALLCALVGGVAVGALALSGLLALEGVAAAPAPVPVVLPPAAVAVRVPPPPPVTLAPTAPEWTATLPPAAR